MAYSYGNVTKCTVGSGSTNSTYECRLGYQVNSQSISNNTSSITLRLEVRSINSSYKTYGYNQTSTIDGTALSSKSFDMRSTNTWQLFGERTITVSHNANGSYSATKSGSFTTTASGSYSLKSGSASVTVAPVTIPRASEATLSASSIELGSSVTINTNRKSSSFTHKITYKFGNTSGTIASSAGASASWIPPLSLASQIPNATSGICTITCETYNGSSLIGTKSVSLTLKVPASVVPNISNIALSEANGAVPSSWGCYVQNKSRLKVVTTASGAYGSTIKSYKIAGIDNGTYNSSNFTSNTLTQSGTKTITVTVTDSRGRTATKTTTYTCTSYANPSISVASVSRCNSNGTANEEGTSVKYSFKANISAVNNKNSHVFKIGYKKSTDSSYAYVTIANDGYSLEKTNVVLSGLTFSVDNSYDFQFYAGDYFIATNRVQHIDTGFTLIDYNASGKSMAFGKVSEANSGQKLLEVALPTDFQEGIKISGTELFLKIYPVGSIYMSMNSTSPSVLFGGSWEQLKDRFLIGAGGSYGINEKGGNTSRTTGQASGNTGSTTLTINQIPSHQHGVQGYNGSGSAVSWTERAVTYASDSKGYGTVSTNYTGGGQGHTHSLNAHTHSVSVIPPYLGVYMWKRLS